MKRVIVSLWLGALFAACRPSETPDRSAEPGNREPARGEVAGSVADRAVQVPDPSLVQPPVAVSRSTRASVGSSDGTDPSVRELTCMDTEGHAQQIDPRTNPNHCGECNRRCCGRFCIEGRCTSDGPPGTTACPLSPEEERARGCFGDVSVRVMMDPRHCGTCERHCAAGESCVEGECARSEARP